VDLTNASDSEGNAEVAAEFADTPHVQDRYDKEECDKYYRGGLGWEEFPKIIVSVCIWLEDRHPNHFVQHTAGELIVVGGSMTTAN
jgi:hypothetical protein